MTVLSRLPGLISPGRVCVCSLLLQRERENRQVPNITAKSSLPVAKETYCDDRKPWNPPWSLRKTLLVTTEHRLSSSTWRWICSNAAKDFEIKYLFQLQVMIENYAAIRFNCSACRPFCWLWIQVLQARPTDVRWEINSFLPGINIPHCHYDRPDWKSYLILSHLSLILFIYICEVGKVTQCFQKCCDVCAGNSIRGKCWVLLLKPLKREQFWEKSFLCSFPVCFQDTPTYEQFW